MFSEFEVHNNNNNNNNYNNNYNTPHSMRKSSEEVPIAAVAVKEAPINSGFMQEPERF